MPRLHDRRWARRQEKGKGLSRRGFTRFVGALATLKPRAFVLKNAPGLVNANKSFTYKATIEDFSQLNVQWGEVQKVTGNEVAKSPEKVTKPGYRELLTSSQQEHDKGSGESFRRQVF